MGKTKVRYLFLKDIPEYYQRQVLDVSRIVTQKVQELLSCEPYQLIANTVEGKTIVEEFCTAPSAKGQVGSVTLYQKGETYSCMIQLTGHVRNPMFSDESKLEFGKLVRTFFEDVFNSVQKQIKTDYEMKLDNEASSGHEFEGFDVYPNNANAREIWEDTEGKPEEELIEEYYDDESSEEYFDEKSHGTLKYDFRKAYDWNTGHSLKIIYSLDGIKINRIGNGTTEGMSDKEREEYTKDVEKHIKKKGNMDHASKGQRILAIVDRVTGERLQEAEILGPFAPAIPSGQLDLEDIDNIHEYYNNKGENFKKKYINKIKVGEIDHNSLYKSTHWFKNSEGIMTMRGGYKIKSDNTISRGTQAESLKHGRGAKLNDIKKFPLSFTKDKPVYNHPSKKDKRDNPDAYKESYDDLNFYNEEASQEEEPINPNAKMDLKRAKQTLRTLSKKLINDLSDENKKNMTQYTANIYANLITKNLLKVWAPSFKKLTITLDSYQSMYTFEFKIPKMTQDFISRFVDGRESIQGFLHRTPEIKIKMSPRIFHTMKSPDDAYNFFQSAIKYYDQKIEAYSMRLMKEVMRLDRGLKHLISTTKLSGLVTCPMTLLFVFDDVHMDNHHTFELSKDDINSINQFIRNISTRYAAPEKEKKAIINDVQNMVKALHESFGVNENTGYLSELSKEIQKYYDGYYQESIDQNKQRFIFEQLDQDWCFHQTDPKIQYLQEKFGVKKLKKIPRDTIAYIQIETESIESANDKLLIASYCLSKLEIVEWYIELLEVGSRKYIVPHDKNYLNTLRTQLLACYDQIMKTKINRPSDRPIIGIQYPKGYEG